MLPAILGAARAVLPTLARSAAPAAAGANTSRVLSAAQFGAAAASSSSDETQPAPQEESNPVYNR